jgi:hypothetical protein
LLGHHVMHDFLKFDAFGVDLLIDACESGLMFFKGVKFGLSDIKKGIIFGWGEF